MMYLLAIWVRFCSCRLFVLMYPYVHELCCTVAHAQVSEWRHGEAAEPELAGTVVIKPLVGQGSQAQPYAQANGLAEEEEQEEDEEEGADLLQLHAALFRHRRICPITHAWWMYVH